MPSPERVVLHVDMNAYFASVEQKANPLVRNKPVLVVADSKRRSVIMAASYEARAYGIKTGMNLYEALKLCPKAIAIDGNSDKYLDSTQKIMQTLESFTDQVEMFSCDEAFMDVTGSQKYFGTDGEGIAKKLKKRVNEYVGLPCSVGVAPNKLLAKLASEKMKPDGLTVIHQGNLSAVLEETAIDEMCGIGDKLKVQLNELGIQTCKELGETDLGLLQNHFGIWGYWLKRMGQGLDNAPVGRLEDAENVKSVGHSMTFPKDTLDMDLLQSYLLLLSEKVAVRMRRGGHQGATISLYVRFNDFTSYSKQRKIKDHTDDGYRIFRTALELLNGCGFPKTIRLLGVSVSSLVKTEWQELMFTAMRNRKILNQTADSINAKYGKFTLKPASFIHAEKFGILHAPIPPTIAARRAR